MTQPGETSNPDTVSFGNARESQPERERPVVQPKPPAESGRPAEPVGGSSGPAMDLTRRALVAVALFTVIALVVAVVALVRSGDSDSSTLPAVETHELSQDQAACLRFGLVERRFDATVPVRQGRESSVLRPGLLRALDRGLAAVDAIAANYPEADYRIIDAFADVGDESAALLAGNATDVNSVSEALGHRKDTVSAARNICLEVAGFDTVDMTPAG